MSRRSGPRAALRTARGILLATCSAALSVSAHALGGGHLPDAPTTVLLSALIGWAATAAADRTRGVTGVMAVLGTGQLLLHVALAGMSGHSSTSAAMIAAHVVATACTALLIAHAESMLAVAVAALELLLPRVSVTVPVPPATARPAAVRPVDLTPLAQRLLRSVHGRRGPPRYS
ncbi:hypothetical protein ABZ863_02620 [Saccharomonospora sp. NPDC046836]|uniref:hypothetical protein n=1 Tax=Saccharomonospora sp. NPDC046836 TaxID=3156921 RepID=UPI0033F58097